MRLFVESFGGTNADSLTNATWTSSATGTGAKVEIQSNSASFNLGTVAGGVCSFVTNDYVLPADFDLYFEMTIKTASDTGYGGDWSGHYWEGVTSSGWGLNATGPTTAIGGSVSVTLTTNDVLRFRFRRIANHFMARSWKNTTTEPTTWNIDALSSQNVERAGTLDFYFYDNSGSTLNEVARLNNIIVMDMSAPATIMRSNRL